METLTSEKDLSKTVICGQKSTQIKKLFIKKYAISDGGWDVIGDRYCPVLSSASRITEHLYVGPCSSAVLGLNTTL